MKKNKKNDLEFNQFSFSALFCLSVGNDFFI